MKLLRIVAIFLMTLFARAEANPLVLSSGIAVKPAASLDLTYQVIPDYDPNEKVIARWDGDKLAYFLTVEKLPPGWLNPEQYFTGFMRDMRDSGRKIEQLSTGKYKGVASISGQFIEFRSKAASEDSGSTQVVHFLTDGKVSFVAVATATGKLAEKQMANETALLFKSAYLPSRDAIPPASVKTEQLYVGTWDYNGLGPNGQAASMQLVLKEDLTFSAQVQSQGATIFSAVGVWSVAGQKLQWTYMRSEPPLPAHKKDDEDEIISLANDRLRIRSKISGLERELIRRK